MKMTSVSTSPLARAHYAVHRQHIVVRLLWWLLLLPFALACWASTSPNKGLRWAGYIVASLLLLFALLGRSSGDSSEEVLKDADAKSGGATTAQEEPAEPSAPATSPAETPSTEAVPVIEQALRDRLNLEYSDKAWLSNIETVDVQDNGQIWIGTNLYPDVNDSDTLEAAQEICVAVSGFEIMELDGFSGVRVAANGGLRIVWRQTVDDSCSA